MYTSIKMLMKLKTTKVADSTQMFALQKYTHTVHKRILVISSNKTITVIQLLYCTYKLIK